MIDSPSGFQRDLFEIENARNLTRDELVATFVPTTAFFRLLSAKNHIVLGSRGSGKTALAKMLSHDHLARLPNDAARKVVESRSFIGIYVPMRLEWVGALKNKPWQTESEVEQFFQWRLNISACLWFLITLQSCLERYLPDPGKRARAERDLSAQIGRSWAGSDKEFSSVRQLRDYLEDVEYDYQQALLRNRIVHPQKESPAIGLPFHADLFTPLRRAIVLTSRVLDIPEECTWLVCLDEAEFLTVVHHRILNSYLRSYSGKLAFKITTMPYAHYTLETNTGVPLDVGHDFEYVYIDQDPVLQESSSDDGDERFAVTIFNKRARASGNKYKELGLKELLGPSILLDPQDSMLLEGGRFLELLRKYANSETALRAERLLNDPPAFRDQISRKMQGALLLREAVQGQRGREELNVYSGASMAIRCGDGNPRRLIRIFNSLLLRLKWSRSGPRRQHRVLSPKEQTRILTAVATSALTRVQSEPIVGPALYRFLKSAGEFMQFQLLDRPLGTDQIYSIEIDNNVSEADWKVIQAAVGLARTSVPKYQRQQPGRDAGTGRSV